jgi:hypothetical protein
MRPGFDSRWRRFVLANALPLGSPSKKHLASLKLFLFLTAICMAGQASALPLVENRFDSTAEGWTVTAGASGPVHIGTGGNPGGYITGTDIQGNDIWYFSAPASQYSLQTWTDAYGGLIRFDLKQIGGTGPPITGSVDVIIWSWDSSVSGDVVYSGLSNPGSDWTSYQVGLVETGWVWEATGVPLTQTEMEKVVTSFHGLMIRGDFLDTQSGETPDTAGLDNVSINPVPEPSTAALFSLGLLALASGARRR